MRRRVRTYGPIVTTCTGSEIGHPDCSAGPGILKQSQMFVENHSPSPFLSVEPSDRDPGLICLHVGILTIIHVKSGPGCPVQASPIIAEKYRLASVVNTF